MRFISRSSMALTPGPDPYPESTAFLMSQPNSLSFMRSLQGSWLNVQRFRALSDLGSLRSALRPLGVVPSQAFASLIVRWSKRVFIQRPKIFSMHISEAPFPHSVLFSCPTSSSTPSRGSPPSRILFFHSEKTWAASTQQEPGGASAW